MREWDSFLQKTKNLEEFKCYLALMKLLLAQVSKNRSPKTVLSGSGYKSINSPNTADIKYEGWRSVREKPLPKSANKEHLSNSKISVTKVKVPPSGYHLSPVMGAAIPAKLQRYYVPRFYVKFPFVFSIWQNKETEGILPNQKKMKHQIYVMLLLLCVCMGGCPPSSERGWQYWKTDVHLKPPLTQEQTRTDEKAARTPATQFTLISHWQR